MCGEPRNLTGRRLRCGVGALAACLVSASIAAAEIIASDNASNLAYSDGWQDADNGGTGFGPWSLFSSGGTEGFAGFFIGDPAAAGISNVGIGTSAFGEYANPNASGAFANADRSLSQPLNVGDVFSFVWGVNFDSGAGNKGFNLYTGGVSGTQVINTNMGGSATITVNGNDTGFTYGTNPMTWSFEMITSGSLRVTATPRNPGDATYTQIFPVAGAVDAFRFYASALNSDFGDQRQPYFNDLQVMAVPEPRSLSLAVCSAIGLAVTGFRRFRKIHRA